MGFYHFFLTSAPYIRFCCLSTYLSILFQLIESQSVVSDDTDAQILLFVEFLKLITLLLIIMQKNLLIFVYIEVVHLPKVGSVSTPYLKVVLGFTGIRHGLYAHYYSHCLSTIDGIMLSSESFTCYTYVYHCRIRTEDYSSELSSEPYKCH